MTVQIVLSLPLLGEAAAFQLLPIPPDDLGVTNALDDPLILAVLVDQVVIDGFALVIHHLHIQIPLNSTRPKHRNSDAVIFKNS